jgi:hypothetical protein
MVKKFIYCDIITNSMAEEQDAVKNHFQIRKDEERDYISKNAKPLHELVIEATFTVDHVLSEQESNNITPTSEARIGGSSPSYSAGFSFKTTLTVRPAIDNADSPIRKLIFEGYSSVPRNSHIIAKIPIYETKRNLYGDSGSAMTPQNERQFNRNSKYYVARPAGLEEKAIEIDIRDITDVVEDKTISNSMRTERSVDYKHYQKQE